MCKSRFPSRFPLHPARGCRGQALFGFLHLTSLLLLWRGGTFRLHSLSRKYFYFSEDGRCREAAEFKAFVRINLRFSRNPEQWRRPDTDHHHNPRPCPDIFGSEYPQYTDFPPSLLRSSMVGCALYSKPFCLFCLLRHFFFFYHSNGFLPSGFSISSALVISVRMTKTPISPFYSDNPCISW